MIKIIKHGEKKVFKKTCIDCECVFEYNIDDVSFDYSVYYASNPPQYRRIVICPECGKKLVHDVCEQEWPPSGNEFPKVIYTTNTNSLDCETCPSRPNPDNIVVGDSPCNWCKKMQPTCASKVNDEPLLDPMDIDSTADLM